MCSFSNKNYYVLINYGRVASEIYVVLRIKNEENTTAPLGF